MLDTVTPPQVTAVIVDNAIQSGNQMRELALEAEDKRRLEICQRLECLFLELDTSGDGELQREELLEAPSHIRDRLAEVLGHGERSRSQLLFQ